MDTKINNLLQWIGNTVDVDHKPSTHSFILPRIAVKDNADWGRGICAEEPIYGNQLLIRIPPSFLLNYTSVVKHITSFNKEISLTDAHYQKVYVPADQSQKTDFITDNIYLKLTMEQLTNLSSFQIIAMYITLEMQRSTNSWWKPFLDMLPPTDDFNSMPLVWKIQKRVHGLPDIDAEIDGDVDANSTYDDLLRYLPSSTVKHSNKVAVRFETDYAVVSGLLKKIVETKTENVDGIAVDNDDMYRTIRLMKLLPLETFLWAWLCINSRCLYMDIPQKKSITDNFTMAPYVDFLNHSPDDQCVLKIDNTGFQVLTGSGTKYKPNEQIFLSYGPHSNEFLLCEYGFMLNENKWNDVDITNYITMLLSSTQKQYLDSQGYYGEYTVNVSSGPSFRTEVALATLQERDPQNSRKLAAVVNGNLDSSVYEKHSNILLKEILDKLIKQKPKEFLDIKNDPRVKVIQKLYEDIEAIVKSVQ